MKQRATRVVACWMDLGSRRKKDRQMAQALIVPDGRLLCAGSSHGRWLGREDHYEAWGWRTMRMVLRYAHVLKGREAEAVESIARQRRGAKIFSFKR